MKLGPEVYEGLKAARMSYPELVSDRAMERSFRRLGPTFEEQLPELPYTPFPRLEKANDWKDKKLKEQIKKCGGKVIIMVHPFYFSKPSITRAISDEQYKTELLKKDKEFSERLKKVIKGTVPILVLEAEGNYSFTSLDLEDHGADPEARRVYFVPSESAIKPMPVRGWDLFHKRLKKLGVERAYVGGRNLTFITDEEPIDSASFYADYKGLKPEEKTPIERITERNEGVETEAGNKAKRRRVKEVFGNAERAFRAIARSGNIDRADAVEKITQKKMREIKRRDWERSQCVGIALNELQSREGIKVRQMPGLCFPEKRLSERDTRHKKTLVNFKKRVGRR